MYAYKPYCLCICLHFNQCSSRAAASMLPAHGCPHLWPLSGEPQYCKPFRVASCILWSRVTFKTVTIFSESGLAEPFQYISTLYMTFLLKENNLGYFCSSVLYTLAPVMQPYRLSVFQECVCYASYRRTGSMLFAVSGLHAWPRTLSPLRVCSATSPHWWDCLRNYWRLWWTYKMTGYVQVSPLVCSILSACEYVHVYSSLLCL